MIDRALPMRTRSFNASNASFSDPAGPGTSNMSPCSAAILKKHNQVLSLRRFNSLLVRFNIDPEKKPLVKIDAMIRTTELVLPAVPKRIE